MCQNCNNHELRIPTEVPGVTLVTRANGGGFEFLRETETTMGEVQDPDDQSTTIEVITIKRKSLQQI